MNYPRVLGEFDTVKRILKGYSIARFGDGELKILDGYGYRREPVNGALTAEMRMVVAIPADDCMLGIPTMHPDSPKAANWARHYGRFCKYFSTADGRRYGSAFISRPDSAAETLESREYCELLAKLWKPSRRVVVLCEADSKLLPAVRLSNPGAAHIECPSHEAYALIDEFEARIATDAPDVALLSCGPTATCLANRLARIGIQGVDLGSIGALLLRWLHTREAMPA